MPPLDSIVADLDLQFDDPFLGIESPLFRGDASARDIVPIPQPLNDPDLLEPKFD